MWDREQCHCKHGCVSKHMVWHGWKINWNEIEPKLSPECRKMLKEKFLCKECHDKIVSGIKLIQKEPKQGLFYFAVKQNN